MAGLGLWETKGYYKCLQEIMGPRDWLYPEVDIEITGEMVGEKDCEPGANISNE